MLKAEDYNLFAELAIEIRVYNSTRFAIGWSGYYTPALTFKASGNTVRTEFDVAEFIFVGAASPRVSRTGVFRL